MQIQAPYDYIRDYYAQVHERIAQQLGPHVSTDGSYLYFQWEENLGDIWVMDVVTDESK